MRRAWVAVQEDERRAAARLLVVDGGVECLDVGHVGVLYGSRGVSRSVARSWTRAFAPRVAAGRPAGPSSRSSSTGDLGDGRPHDLTSAVGERQPDARCVRWGRGRAGVKPSASIALGQLGGVQRLQAGVIGSSLALSRPPPASLHAGTARASSTYCGVCVQPERREGRGRRRPAHFIQTAARHQGSRGCGSALNVRFTVHGY